MLSSKEINYIFDVLDGLINRVKTDLTFAGLSWWTRCLRSWETMKIIKWV